MKARFLRDLSGFTGTAKLWALSSPIAVDDVEGPVTHIITSATHAFCSSPETYIFPADSAGRIIDWGELPGSFRGAIDHQRAIAAFCKLYSN